MQGQVFPVRRSLTRYLRVLRGDLRDLAPLVFLNVVISLQVTKIADGVRSPDAALKLEAHHQPRDANGVSCLKRDVGRRSTVPRAAPCPLARPIPRNYAISHFSLN